MRRVLVLLLFAMLPILPVLAQESRDPYQYFFNETFGDFSEELEVARSEGKSGVMLFFEMDDCPFCHWMKQNVLSQGPVQQYYRDHFKMFSVDVEGDVEVVNFDGQSMSQKDFSFKEHRVRATPVILFVDLDGKIVHRHTGRTANPEEFMLMGRFVVDGLYKDMPFTRYKREQKK